MRVPLPHKQGGSSLSVCSWVDASAVNARRSLALHSLTWGGGSSGRRGAAAAAVGRGRQKQQGRGNCNCQPAAAGEEW